MSVDSNVFFIVYTVGIKAVFINIIPDDNAKGRLFYAFLELIKKKPYPKIRVSEFIEKHRLTARLFTDITVYGFVICL